MWWLRKSVSFLSRNRSISFLLSSGIRPDCFCLLVPSRCLLIQPSYIKERIKPREMKIDSEQFRALFTPQLNQLVDLFERNKFELRIAGGAVRDLLMGIAPVDVDFATTATPDQMKQLFDRENIRMLHKRGEEHGTITCRLDNVANFEITTLRIDVVCDGRRAEVQYTTDWQLDANRRDLTINSLFLGLDGTVYDYFDGINDLNNRRIAFVGNARQRIQEDYLRILRYFRFYGRIAKEPDAHEAETIAAIVENAKGLNGISGERLWSELKRIVLGRFAGPVIRTMLTRCSLGPYLGLPCNADVDRFCGVLDGCQGRPLESMSAVVALFDEDEDVDRLHVRCKLSNAEMAMGRFIMAHRSTADKSLKFFSHLVLDEESSLAGTKQPDGRNRVIQLLRYLGEDEQGLIEWKVPIFPIDGIRLAEAGIERGRPMRFVLLYLFELWKKSDCQMSADELVKRANDKEIVIPDSNERRKRKHLK